MPASRGPGVWKNFGLSYEQLSAREADKQSSASSRKQEQSSSRADQQLAAGNPSSQPLRGSGTFVAQTSWELASAGHKLSSTTEARTQYQHPAYSRRDPIRTDRDNFPKPNEPHEFKTLKQHDFPPGLLERAERVQPFSLRDNGRLLLPDVTPVYETQKARDFPCHNVAELRGSFGSQRAGLPATQPPGYHIIHGGAPLGNNAFEFWRQGRDYRRHY